MGIGRREFVKLFSVALAGTAFDPLNAIITNDDLYVNKMLGIMFSKPFGWSFVRVTDFGRLKNEQTLGNGWNDNKDTVWNELGEPICIATKYPGDDPSLKGVFSPTISLNVTPKAELNDLGCNSLEEIIALSQKGTSMILKNFAVTRRYPPYEICGCKVFENDSTYSFEHVDIDEPLKVELKTFHVEHNGSYYDFNCHQSVEQGQIADREFASFKKSIKFL